MEEATTYGLISLLPVCTVIVMSIITKRTLESLVVGSLIAHVLLDGSGFLPAWIESAQKVIGDSAWYILVFGVIGIVIALLERSGGAQGISNLGAKYGNTREKALMITWVLGIIVFIEDYLNNLGVGVAMRNVSDRFKVSRELFAYLVNSTGAAVCVLVPVSSWGVYTIGLYDSLDVTAGGSAFGAYVASIPYMFYAWLAVIIAPLFIYKIIPLFGPMKKAELRARAGDVFPESYHKNPALSEQKLEIEVPEEKCRAMNFLIPMLIFIVVAIATNGDILLGGILTFVGCAILYLPQKLMGLRKFFDGAFEGFKSMSFVTTIVLASFILSSANDKLGLTKYVIDTVEPFLSATWLPVITFVLIAFLAFTSGSFWGTMAIVSPIIIPLAESANCNVYLIGAAMVSAATFASHTCYYADAVTLISAVTQIQNTDYAKTSIPLALIPFFISVVIYTVVGFVSV